ncbi:MAG: cytochrome c oxidase assembly protein [Alphaproteobacteria bacterium]|nr:cytochrome c oxidase assembly protein [Alphaproteobacteria bacterium]MCW5744328.1 cytochrome c oxidase assembly protein [Alphaproteobacteria bacterium]
MQVLLAGYGPLSAGMGVHILLMNLLAPAAALGSVRVSGTAAGRMHGLVPASVVQLLLLWGWHAPPSLAAAMEQPALHFVMQLSLALAAVWFWRAVVRAMATCPWRAIAALLLTSKLFCLLGVLLTFAARPLYPAMTHHDVMAADPLADQQLAGLMMLVACPLSYLVAAVVVAWRWLAPAAQAGHHPEDVRVT